MLCLTKEYALLHKPFQMDWSFNLLGRHHLFSGRAPLSPIHMRKIEWQASETEKCSGSWCRELSKATIHHQVLHLSWEGYFHRYFCF